jgi:hypothetical protein
MPWRQPLRRRGLGFLIACLGLGAGAAAQEAPPQDRVRPIKVGNVNVAVVGGGYTAHDHPTYEDHVFLNLSYQRRILRREVRAVPLWVRFALQFTEDERTLENSFTYWPSETVSPYTETVQEQTSDFGIRAELMVDAVHGKNFAVYGGGGFVIHTVNFTSRGLQSGQGDAAGLETTENQLAPSLAAGARLFSAKHPYTFYAEARYGFTFGRALGPQDQNPPQVVEVDQFELESASNVSIEGGVGVHW